MSYFQLENSYSQPNKSLLTTNFVHGGVSHDAVLVSKGVPVTLDLFQINQSPPPSKFHHPCPSFKVFLNYLFNLIIFHLVIMI